MALNDDTWRGFDMFMYAVEDGLYEEEMERKVVFELVQRCEMGDGSMEETRTVIGSFEVRKNSILFHDVFILAEAETESSTDGIVFNDDVRNWLHWT